MLDIKLQTPLSGRASEQGEMLHFESQRKRMYECERHEGQIFSHLQRS